MPRVPDFQPVHADTTVLVPAHADTSVDSPSMAAIPGQQMEKAGQAVAGLSNVVVAAMAKIQESNNVADAKSAEARATIAYNDLLHNPDTGFVSLQGKNALEGKDGAINAALQLRQDALDRIENPEIRRLAEPTITTHLATTLDRINAHTLQEGVRYRMQASDARVRAVIQSAADNYDSPSEIVNAGRVIWQEAQAQGDALGWSEDQKKKLANNYFDAAAKARYESWRMKDPVGALANFMGGAGSAISPALRVSVAHQLFEAAAPALAGQINLTKPGIVANSAGDLEYMSLGLRNNNPGNLVKTNTSWEGQVQGNDARFATFETPEAGIRAMGKTLLAYQDKYGINTVQDIGARWAPASENDTPAYISALAKYVGVNPTAPLNLHDQATLTKVARGIIEIENGPTNAAKISDQQIAAGLTSARDGTSLPATASAPSFRTVYRDPAIPTTIPLVDSLPPDWKLRVLQMAQAQAHQDMLDAREALRGKVQDAQASYMANGYAPHPPGPDAFVAAYGQAEGVARYKNLQSVATLGQQLQQIRTLPATALDNLVAAAKPVPGTDGFAVQQHNYEILNRAIDQVQTARTRDPVGYALATGSYSIKPIQSLNDTPKLVEELGRRAAAAPTMATDYGTAPQLLTKDEAKGIAAVIKAEPVEQQKTQLASIYQGIGDMGLFKQTMQQIAPDNPTAAVAGIYQAKGYRTNQSQDVADLILRGQAILTPNTKEDGTGHEGGRSLIKMPEARLLLSDFNNATGDAFRGREHAADLFMQTARAIYAARSAEEGDYSGNLDSKRWKASINLATGGLESHNGVKIVLPYGMGYDQFQNTLKAQVDRIVSVGAPINTSAAEMMRLPLESAGDGRYYFRRGAGYLVNHDGRPVIVDLNVGAHR